MFVADCEIPAPRLHPANWLRGKLVVEYVSVVLGTLCRESALVVALGSALGLTLAGIRGFPEIAAVPSEVTGACLPPDPGRPSIQWIAPAQARRSLGDPSVLFVDARSREEFVTGHIAGALNVPVNGTVPDSLISQLRGARLVIAYCDTTAGCARSTRLAGLLVNAGFPDVRVLEGGFPEWEERGYPAEAGTCRLCP